MDKLISLLVQTIKSSELHDIPKQFKHNLNLVNGVLEEAINAVSLADKIENIEDVLNYERVRMKTLSGFVESEAYWTKSHVDSPRVYHAVERKGRTTEMIEWQESYSFENWIPDRKSFIDMGLEDRKTPWLDDSKDRFGRVCNTMNDRMFREMCVVYGNKLCAIHKKSEVDINTGTKPEWVAKVVGCELVDALTMVESWKRLGFDFKTCRKMVRGYWSESEMTWKNGLQNTGKIGGRRFAKYFEELVIQVVEIDQFELNRQYWFDIANSMIDSGNWRLKFHEYSPISMMNWIENRALVDMDADLVVDEIEDFLDQDGFISHLGDEEPTVRGEDGFGAFPLYDGSEDISYELGVEIREADLDHIGVIQKRLFESRNPWNGAKVRAEYFYFTDSMRQQIWSRINERKETLLKDVMKTLTETSNEVIAIAKNMGSVRQSRALVSAYCAGNGFNISGDVYKWEHKPSTEERYAVWGVFRKEIEK